MMGGTGLEPVTPSLSRRRRVAPAHGLRRLVLKAAAEHLLEVEIDQPALDALGAAAADYRQPLPRAAEEVVDVRGEGGSAGVLRVRFAVVEELARGAVGDCEIDDHEDVGLA